MKAPVEPSTTPRKGRWRRYRTPILVGAAFVVAVVIAAVTATQPQHSEAYDPASTEANGTRALVNVLRDHGVDVDIARSADALDRVDTGSETTIMVTQSQMLGRPTAERLLAHASDGARIVVAAPDPFVSDLLGAPAAVGATNRSVPALCYDRTWSGLEIRADNAVTYETASDPDACFYDATTKGAVLVKGTALWTWGAPEALTNDQILRGDDAAVGLRLLGARKHLVWYVPTSADLDTGEGHAATDLLPRGIAPGLWLALLAVIALAFARGRRLGPLAVEPLPVSVRSDETARSLGRLYRRAGDPAHAAAVLRGATRARLATRLRLGRSASADEIVRAVAARTGRPLDEVAALLADDAPAARDNRTLMDVADKLAALEEEVRP